MVENIKNEFANIITPKNFKNSNMKKLLLVTLLFTGLTSSYFTQSSIIDNCYINFEGVKNLTAKTPDKLPESAALPREVDTEEGKVAVSRIAGYRVLYLNDKNAPFVNLKVEKSAKGSYESDKENLIKNLRYLLKVSGGMKTNDIIELKLGGQKVYGLSRNSIEKGSVLGTFIMFPGNDIVVYFYFKNLKPEYRNFKSLKDYEKQRDRFIKKYVKHIKKCK